MITLNLPYPPSVNHCYGRVAGKTYLKPAAKKYRKQVASIAHQRMFGRVFESGQVIGVACDLAVRVVLNAPTNRAADIDNGQKALLDALTKAGVWQDDKQVKVLLLVVGESCETGSCTVSIAKLSDVSVEFAEV